MKLKRFIAVSLTLIMVLSALAGCGAAPAPEATPAPAEADPAEAPAEAADSSGESTHVGDIYIPTEQEALETLGLTEIPEKILCATYNTTMMAYNLGVTLSGTVTTKRPLPEELKDVPSIGVVTGSGDFDFELVIALAGDLVLSDKSFEAKLKPTLDEQGIKSFFVETGDLTELQETLALLGSAFGKRDETIALLSDWQAQIAAMKEEVAGKASPVVLVIRKATNMATSTSYVGSLFETLGVTCATDLMGLDGEDVDTYVPYDLEKIIEVDPDYILIPGGAELEGDINFLNEIMSSEAWASLSAVKNGRVLPVTDTYYQPLADMSCMDALRELIETVYD